MIGLLLVCLFLILTPILLQAGFWWRLLNAPKRRKIRRKSLKRKGATTETKPYRSRQKPAWVKAEVLKLIALTSSSMGCRVIAAMFNARFLATGESVGKTYVANLRKESQYEIAKLRKQFREPPKSCEPNQTWGLDWTHITIANETLTVLGVIDHGSRKLLALCFADKCAATVIRIISELTNKFGKPNFIRTDNDGAFVSHYFAQAMQRLGIQHQRSKPHSPWMNGRIERFFGTFKRAIRQMQIDSKACLQQALDEFSYYYNNIRPHQNLGYRTPQMAWSGQRSYPRTTPPNWFSSWEAVLCGWFYGEVKKPADG